MVSLRSVCVRLSTNQRAPTTTALEQVHSSRRAQLLVRCSGRLLIFASSMPTLTRKDLVELRDDVFADDGEITDAMLAWEWTEDEAIAFFGSGGISLPACEAAASSSAASVALPVSVEPWQLTLGQYAPTDLRPLVLNAMLAMLICLSNLFIIYLTYLQC